MLLEEPFPIAAIPDLYRWLESIPAIRRSPEFPADWPSFEAQMTATLSRARTWAVRSEHGRLAGAVLLEPAGTMAGQAFVVAARWAWGKGILEKAVEHIMGIVFTGERPLGCVFGIVRERNYPARHFNERVGMRLKNVYPELQNRIYELTREQWLSDHFAHGRHVAGSASAGSASGPTNLPSSSVPSITAAV